MRNHHTVLLRDVPWVRGRQALIERRLEMQGLKDVEFREGEFTVRTLREEELKSSYRFRHKVFAEQLKWVPASPDGEELDLYGFS